MSRAAMQEARDLLVQDLRDSRDLQVAAALPEQSPSPIPNLQNYPHSPINQEPVPQTHQPPDPSQDFISRLAVLETQRRVETPAVPTAISPVISPATSPATSTSSPLPSTFPLPSQSNYLSLLTSNTTNVPIFIPAPDKRGRIFPITSISRAWAYQPERSAFVWPGPIPTSNGTHVALAAVQTPAFVQDMTSFIIVHVSGVGDATTQCVFLPSAANANTKWTTWLPCSPATRFIKPVPTPWNLQLLDAFGERNDSFLRCFNTFLFGF